MPTMGEPVGAQRHLPARFVELRGVILAALLAAGVAVGVATVAPGGDARVPDALPAASAPPSPGAALPATHGSTPSQSATRAYAQLPLAFEPNRGQSDRRVRFLSRGAGYGLFLTGNEAVLSLRPQPKRAGDAAGFLAGGSSGALGDMSGLTGISQAKQGAVLRFGLQGANANAKVSGAQRLPGQSNYMRGNDPRAWHTGVPSYARVRYASVYPGTDLVYYGRQGKLEYDFVLAPGADPGRIALSIAGAQQVSIDRRGDLVLQTASGQVVQRRPLIYQRVGSQRRVVSGRYVLTGKGRVGFRVGAYDRSRPLVIDPVISYSSYLGGSGFDAANGIAVDTTGTYLAGYTDSTNFPTQAAGQPASGGGASDVFITKLSATGNALVYSTYLGGSSGERAEAIAVDSSGNAYVTGATLSDNFPLAPAAGAPVQVRRIGLGDAFVAKLSATGSLLYSTYLGGSGDDGGRDIAVDSAGNGYVTGFTGSSAPLAFPTRFPLQSANGGTVSPAVNAFVSKLSFSGVPATDLVYSTYLGGSTRDTGYGIAVDSGGAAYVTGEASSENFPTASAIKPTKPGTDYDAFVSKLNAAGSALVYSTFLGGDSQDAGRAIAVDSVGSAYVTGSTKSVNFPTVSPVQAGRSAFDDDAFVSKFNPGGSALLSSTYLGGSAIDVGFGIAVDSAGSAYVAGETSSSDFPTSSAAQATSGGGSRDAFVSKLSGSGSALSTLAYSTYLGGSGFDHGDDIAVDSAGNPYVAGESRSTDFPTKSPFQGAKSGTADAFVSKLIPGADVSVSKTDAPDPVLAGQPLTYTLSVANAGPDVAKAVSVSDPLPSGVTLLSASADCSQRSGTVTCSVGDVAKGASVQREITVRPDSANPALSNTATVASPTFDPVAANNSSTSVTEVRVPAAGSADVSVTKSDSPDPVQSGGELTYTLRASNAGPDSASAVTLRDQLPAGVALVSAPAGCSQPPATVVVCDVGTLAKGGSEQRQIVVRPGAPTPSLSNTATVSSSTADPFSSNNTATASTVVQAVADVSIQKTDSPDPVVAGQQLTYTLTARNLGPDPAPAVVVRDQLPAGVELVSALGCNVVGGAVSCNVGDLANGVSAQRQIVVRPTQADPALVNTATAQSTAADSATANNSATAITEVREAPAPPPGGGTTTPPPGGGTTSPPSGGGTTTPPAGSAGGAVMGASPLPPVGPLAPAVVAVSEQGISPKRFAPAPSGPSALTAKAKRKRKSTGAKVAYRLNMAASVRFTVSQTVRGRKQGKGRNVRCVGQTKKNRKAKPCKRTVTLKGSFVLSGKAGPNSFRFTGRLANKKLKRGSYTLTATPTAQGKTGKPASMSFTITR